MRKTQILVNKPVYLGLSILELSKKVMFLVHGKTDDIYKETAGDVEKRFDTSNYELSKPLPKEKKKKVVGLMKDELGEESIKKFVRLLTKNYSYLKDSSSEDKKAKDTKKCVIRKKLEFEDYDNC